MKTPTVKALYDRYLVPVYHWNGFVAAKAKGPWLWDAEGRKVLDFFAGWGVGALGHCHPAVVRAVRAQTGKLMHIPNNFLQEPAGRLAQALVEATFPSKVFFTNSGAETVEAAIKLVRAWGGGRRTEIIAMQRSFHGRTLGAVSATGQPKYRRGFGPVLSGFRHVPFGDLAAVRRAVNRKTVAVLVEPIQGEGGVNLAPRAYWQGLRRLCTDRKLLLVADEVTTGMGRTGTLFAYQSLGFRPDLLLLAKPIAGGLPMGALIVAKRFADVWPKSTHATTFGGNATAAAAALAVLTTLRRERVLANVRSMSRLLFRRLRALQAHFPVVRDVRGMGLMAALELDRPASRLVSLALEEGLNINCTQERILRLYPALTITRKHVELGVRRLARAMERWLR